MRIAASYKDRESGRLKISDTADEIQHRFCKAERD